MNYPFVNLLKERLNKDLRLFEYGTGYSTLFYASRVQDVISIEYDKTWFDLMGAKVPNNVSLIFREKDIDGEYCRTINEFKQKFDVIIVDGRDRVNCVKQAITRLTPGGVVILDDSSRKKYQQAINYAHEKGFRALSIEGLKPTGKGADRTTIFYRDNNCFGI